MLKQQKLFKDWLDRLMDLNIDNQKVANIIRDHIYESPNYWDPIKAFRDVLQLSNTFMGESKWDTLLEAKDQLLKVLSHDEYKQLEALFMGDQLM